MACLLLQIWQVRDIDYFIIDICCVGVVYSGE
jgi:hypothetical protein